MTVDEALAYVRKTTVGDLDKEVWSTSNDEEALIALAAEVERFRSLCRKSALAISELRVDMTLPSQAGWDLLEVTHNRLARFGAP